MLKFVKSPFSTSLMDSWPPNQSLFSNTLTDRWWQTVALGVKLMKGQGQDHQPHNEPIITKLGMFMPVHPGSATELPRGHKSRSKVTLGVCAHEYCLVHKIQRNKQTFVVIAELCHFSDT
jgi:hypothetical protein